MSWNRNDCYQVEAPVTFEINGVCTSIEDLNVLIQMNTGRSRSNTLLIEDLYNQLLDLNKLVGVLSRKVTDPCYNLCITPGVKEVVALKPVQNLSKPSLSRRIQPVVECKPVVVKKREMKWTNSLASVKRGEVPILGVGNFYKRGERLVDNNGKDLYEYLPVHFGKQIGDLVYMGIVNYEWVGKRNSIYEEFILEYQVYDLRTTTTTIYKGGIFNWKKYADNRINLY